MLQRSGQSSYTVKLMPAIAETVDMVPGKLLRPNHYLQRFEEPVQGSQLGVCYAL